MSHPEDYQSEFGVWQIYKASTGEIRGEVFIRPAGKLDDRTITLSDEAGNVIQSTLAEVFSENPGRLLKDGIAVPVDISDDPSQDWEDFEISEGMSPKDREYIRKSSVGQATDEKPWQPTLGPQPKKTIVVLFGDGSIRSRYIRQSKVEADTVISAYYPELLNTVRGYEADEIRVIRYPEDQWAWAKNTYADRIELCEEQLRVFKDLGIKVIEEEVK